MSSTSVVISREAILQRRACSPRRRRPSILTPSALQIISEEEEYLRSRSPSPTMSGYASTSSSRTTPSLKNRRRHCNLSPSDIQIARDFVGIGDDSGNTSDSEDRLLLVPPSSARLPKTPSPDPSPDSFKLTFTDKSYTFPHPPIPTPSSNSLNVFCGSSSGESSPSGSAMPLTPSSSDEDLLRPRWNSRRGAAVQPLVIQPYFHVGIEIEASVPEVYESWEDKIEMNDKASSFSLSPYTSSFLDSSSSSSDSEDSDIEADSEWYTRELSQVVSLEAPTRSHTQNSRPESMFLPSNSSLRASKRESAVLAASPKRTSKRYIPNYPPPPPPMRSPAHNRPVSAVPSSPASLLEFPTQHLAPTSPASSRALSSPRPPPRTSVPADFSFDDDASSVFSFGMYQDEIDAARAVSPASTSFSQSSFYGAEATYADDEGDFGSPLDTATFDLDSEHRMMLPLSLPGTPIDLEADIAHGLEELRRVPVPASPLPPVQEDEEEFEQVIETVERPTSLASRSSRWSFGTPSPARSFNYGHGPRPSISFSHSTSIAQPPTNTFDEERVLKSKWSSSTLASVREDHEKRASSSKLKLSFLSTSPSKKRSSTSGVTSPSGSPSKKMIPPTPLSPMSFMKKRSSTSRKTEEMQFPPISAFTSPTHGVRRMGSSSTMSDAGSVETTSSTASNGLRRKPIPIELFLRS